MVWVVLSAGFCDCVWGSSRMHDEWGVCVICMVCVGVDWIGLCYAD